MLRAFGAFLMIFWLLSLVVHLDVMARLFGVGALATFAVDLLLAARLAKSERTSKMRGQPLP
jgi:hypothetical protein